MHPPIDLQPLIDPILQLIHRHALPDPAGGYARWTLGGKDHGLNPYGCADAANLLYTLGHFPQQPAERQQWVTVLQSFQDPATGLFHEATHHDFHCTAHCAAALELFDARPLHPLHALHPLLEPAHLTTFLEELDWLKGPWWASHKGAGIYAALAITGEATPAFEERYFDWLWQETDTLTGFWRRGCVEAPEAAPLFHHLAGSFHYLFNLEAARRPLRFPTRMIDTCLHIWEADLHDALGRGITFADIDWVYCITRAGRQTPHRFEDRIAALHAMADRLLGNLFARDYLTDPEADDLHHLFGTVCALAELQSALPGRLRTARPLKLVLDRRPFI